MKFKKIINGIILLALVVLLGIITFSTAQVQENYGPNWETTCIEDFCETKIYSYQKYYQENDIWTEIDENFGVQNCDISFQYCVDRNLYQFNVENGFGDFKVDYGDTNLGFSLNSLGNLPITNSIAEIQDNVLTYRNIVQGIDIRYIYLPHKIKEEIVINNAEAIGGLTQDINIGFNLNSNHPILPDEDSVQIGDLFIRNLYAYDSEWNTIKLNFSLNGGILTLTVPFEWLTAEDRVYPVYIDPTFETNLSVSEDVYVENRLPAPPFVPESIYTRYDSSVLKIGYENKSSVERIYRAGIDWITSSVPDNATITALNMTLTVNTLGDSFNYNISATKMDGNSSDYPDNSSGNEEFWNDMGDGANYTIVSYDFGGKHYFNLINASSDFENNLVNDSFNVGLYSITDTSVYPGTTTNPRIYWSSEAINSSDRPSLVVTYSLVNESEGDDAIVEGIVNSVLEDNISISSNQQIYLVNEVGDHFLGTFGKSTKNNQTWAFNYVPDGDSFIDMPSLFNILNVWENSTLSFDEIVYQVETFINNTIE